LDNISLDILFGILVFLLLLSAFFSGSETALMTLNRYRLQYLVKKKHKGALRAYKLLQRPDRLLGLILLGNNFVNILASSLTTIIAMRIAGDAGIAIGAGILTLVVLIFSEVAPKTLAAIKPELLAFPAAWIYTPLLKIFYPIVWIVNFFANLLLRMVGINAAKHKQETLGTEELRSVVSEAGSLLPPRYQNMLLGILDLESATSEDIMTPRNEIVGIDLEEPIEKIIETIKQSPHTRLPAYKKTIDRVIGFLHVRVLLSLCDEPNVTKETLIKSLSKPTFIPESMPLHIQIQNFKTEKVRVGLIVDEYGDVQGLITLDDLLQGIIGKIVSEDTSIKQQSDGSYIVDGSMTVREFNRVTNFSLPTEGPKTINGLIIEFMETIPQAGTSVVLHGYPVEILTRDKKTIKLVKFHPKKD
jgi:Mg2+/Co2+ transporter CorB